MPKNLDIEKKSPIDLEIEIDENGDLLLTRDHRIMVEIARLASGGQDLSEFEQFYEEKPLNIMGEKDYKSFCG